MNLSLEEISQAVDGSLEGPGNVQVRGYSIDSRTINAGELFFAIKGPRFDGHEFVAQALQKGAAAAVVEEELRPSPAPPQAASPSPSGRGQGDGSVIRVTSTLEALQTLALKIGRAHV